MRKQVDQLHEGGANWSELLPDLLVRIAQELRYLEDIYSFSTVCTSWKIAATSAEITNKNPNPKPTRFPCLMLCERAGDGGDIRDFFRLSDSNIQKWPLPEARNKHCLSSRGWLLTLESFSSRPQLLHPYTRRQILLPPINTFPEFEETHGLDAYYFWKLLLSSPDPSSEHFLVMVIWGEWRLGFCRPGDAEWSVTQHRSSPALMMSDFCYHNNGMVYACTYYGEILVWDVHGPNPTILKSILPETTPDFFITKQLYIVSIGLDDDRLYLVQRGGMFDDGGSRAEKDYRSWFKVYEFSFKRGNFIQVDNLGGKIALFVGFNSSFFLEAEWYKFIKPDCIYFTDDCFERYDLTTKGGGADMGIYNIRDGTIEPHFNLWESRSLVAPPIWVYDEQS